MSDGTPEKRHREDSHNGGDDEKKKKNEKESDQADTSQQLTHGSPEEHHRVGEVNGGADDNCSYASSTSASSMSNGLSSFISSVIEEYDSKAEATISSQNQLTFALDRLTGGYILAHNFFAFPISIAFILLNLHLDQNMVSICEFLADFIDFKFIFISRAWSIARRCTFAVHYAARCQNFWGQEKGEVVEFGFEVNTTSCW